MPHRRSYKGDPKETQDEVARSQIEVLTGMVDTLSLRIRKLEAVFAMVPQLHDILQFVNADMDGSSTIAPTSMETELVESWAPNKEHPSVFNGIGPSLTGHFQSCDGIHNVHIGDTYVDENCIDHIGECELVCTYEFIELEDAPRVASDTSVSARVAESQPFHQLVQPQGGGLEETINLAVLRTVNDTFSATVPMIIANMQSRIGETSSRLEMKIDTQKAEVASLAGYLASSTLKRNAKR